jgi:ketosteroid isomerase-like protein
MAARSATAPPRPRIIASMTNDSRPAIRAARAAFNDAIASRDATAIAAFLLPSYHVVTARSMQRSGKEDSVSSWMEMFGRDRTATASHTRTPEEIHVNEEWGMAEEHGRWTGTLMANDGPIELAGVYAAKWHYTAEGWLLQAEIFTPITVTRLNNGESSSPSARS